MRKIIAALILTLLAGVVEGAATTPQTVTVLIGDYFYFPPVVTINAGDTIEWINVSGVVSHTVTNDAGLFDSGFILPGHAVALVFPARGIFTYHSQFYPSIMVGAVVVNTPDAPALSLVTDPNLFTSTPGVGAFPFPPGYIPTASGLPLLGAPGASVSGTFPVQTGVATLFGGSNGSSVSTPAGLPTNPNILNTGIQSGNTSIIQTGNLLVAQGTASATTGTGTTDPPGSDRVGTGSQPISGGGATQTGSTGTQASGTGTTGTGTTVTGSQPISGGGPTGTANLPASTGTTTTGTTTTGTTTTGTTGTTTGTGTTSTGMTITGTTPTGTSQTVSPPPIGTFTANFPIPGVQSQIPIVIAKVPVQTPVTPTTPVTPPQPQPQPQPAAPVVTSPATDTAVVGVSYIYLITAMNSATQFTAVGLPAGLTLNTQTGAITGTPVTTGDSDVTVTAANFYGTAVSRLKISVVSPKSPSLQIPLAVNAIVGVPFNFALISDGTAPIVFSTSTLPPGLYFSNDSITGVPSRAGTFVVTVSADNIAGNSTAALTITVADPLAGGDTDGDGFPDDLELTVGSNPLDSASTPYGISSTPSLPITIQSLSIKLNAASPGHDSITMTGTIPFQPTGADASTFTVDIGGVIRIFSLSPSGKAQSGPDTATVKQMPSQQTAKITVNLRNGSFAAELNARGLNISRDVHTASKQIDVIVLFNQSFYHNTQTVKFQARANRSGIAKM